MEQVSTLFGEVESQALNIGMLDIRCVSSEGWHVQQETDLPG
jgi:hypothetical protein